MYRGHERVSGRRRVVPILIIVGVLAAGATPSLSDIVRRKRQPVVVRVTEAKFPQWTTGSSPADAADVEIWRYDSTSGWTVVPFQVDEVGPEPEDVKPFILQGAPGRQCSGQVTFPIPVLAPGPCEFLYTLRGDALPAGQLSTNDEIVFLAGYGGACDAPTNSRPDAGMNVYRYKIEIVDDPSGAQRPLERGCVYAFRRDSGTRPAVQDLIEYAPSGDGVPSVCRPTSDACGAIRAPALDIDGDSVVDSPAYQLDFYGNWTIDKWMIGETCVAASPCPSEDMVDIVKWRINSPGETEAVWDLVDESVASCATFRGFIDGPVRVVRDIQGAASGQATRKVEFAYPGEILRRVYVRVHNVAGPAYTYPDLLEANVSALSQAKVYKKNFAGEFDTIDGDGGGVEPAKDDWYQVSTNIGSFLSLPERSKIPTVGTVAAAYDDTTTALWNHPLAPEWDDETGDRGALRTTFAGMADSQDIDTCRDPWTDDMTNILETNYVMLSAGMAGATAGADEVTLRHDDGVLSQCVEEQEFSSGGGGFDPCIVHIQLAYAQDGGPVTVGAGGCTTGMLGWNLYQDMGAGTLERLGSFGADEQFVDFDLVLNELRTYRAAALTSGCAEGVLSDPVTVTHNDIVAPDPPTDLTGVFEVGGITVSWTWPPSGDVRGYKILLGSQSGGPYNQVHSGLLSHMRDYYTIQAFPGTYYVTMRAVDAAGNESVNANELTLVVP